MKRISTRIYLQADSLQEINEAMTDVQKAGWKPAESLKYSVCDGRAGWEIAMEKPIPDLPDVHQDTALSGAHVDFLDWAFVPLVALAIFASLMAVSYTVILFIRALYQ